jgi:hypothetical protein
VKTGPWVEELGRDNIERASELGNVSSAVFQARAAIVDAKTYMWKAAMWKAAASPSGTRCWA